MPVASVIGPQARLVLRIALAGVVASVVLLGHVPSTQPYFYALIGGSLLIYVLVRGPDLLKSMIVYVTSATMVSRWAFLAWATASLFWSSRGGTSIDLVITLLEIHAVGLVVFDAARALEGAGWILAVTFAAGGVGAVAAFLMGAPGGALRLSGGYGNANMLAITSVTALSVFFAGFGLGRRAVAVLFSHAVGLCLLLAVVASSSVKGIVGVLAVWSGALLFPRMRRRVVAQAVVAGAALVVATLTWAPFQQYWRRSAHRIGDVVAMAAATGRWSGSLTERIEFSKEGFALIAQAPIKGHGLSSFFWLTQEGTYTHSNPVELGVSLGVVGILLYYGLYVALLWRASLPENRGQRIGRFILIFVPLMALLDVVTVSFYMKLPTLLMITCAGWALRETRGEARA